MPGVMLFFGNSSGNSMKVLQVKFSHEEPGYARKYYRTVDKKRLVCSQEDFKFMHTWYWCTDLNSIKEPEYPIDLTTHKIEIVENKYGVPA